MFPPHLFLFERSEFLIDTSPKKSLRVCLCARVHACSTNLGFSVGSTLSNVRVTTATAYSAPNRTCQTGQAPLFAQQPHKQRTHGELRVEYPEHDAQA